MRRTDNPEMKRKILTHLAEQYQISEVREPNHLSSYVYCRTRAYLERKQATVPTDEEVMLFALGYGLQDVLTPKDGQALTHTKEGVIYRPDVTFPWVLGEQLVEMKTTRKSAKHHFQDEYIPKTWLDYMQGGCYIRGVNQYDLVVLYMMGNYAPPFPQLYCDQFTFEDWEIEQNWNKLMERKRVLDEAFEVGVEPAPFQNCHDWECSYCRNKLVCETLCMARGLPGQQLERDKELWQ